VGQLYKKVYQDCGKSEHGKGGGDRSILCNLCIVPIKLTI
jgi:hypothetical protein